MVMVTVESWSFRLRTDGGPGQDLYGTVVLDRSVWVDLVIPHDEVQAEIRRAREHADWSLMDHMLIQRILNPEDHHIITERQAQA
jgi:hypothetical protein